jgi:hypothetical protein
MAVGQVTEDSVQVNLRKISKRLSRKWMLMIICAAIVIFFAYLIWMNTTSIVNAYNEYKKNVGVMETTLNKEGTTPLNTGSDNERYDREVVGPAKAMPDNATIQSKIDQMKSLYRPYNELLNKVKPKSGDTVDEKMISGQYDNY